jgi:hypothetical protein
MTRSTLLVTLGAAAIIAQAATAAGEPKNQQPFSTHAVKHHLRANPTIQGEPKNELPFTRRVSGG